MHLGLFLCIKIHSLNVGHVVVIDPFGAALCRCRRGAEQCLIVRAWRWAASPAGARYSTDCAWLPVRLRRTQENVGAREAAGDRYSGMQSPQPGYKQHFMPSVEHLTEVSASGRKGEAKGLGLLLLFGLCLNRESVSWVTVIFFLSIRDH